MLKPKFSHSRPDEESLISAWPLSDDERRRQKKRRRRKKLQRDSLLCGITLAVSYASLNIYASVQLNHELAQARANGEPLTMAELVPPPIPNSENAAPLYRQAASLIVFKEEEGKIWNALNSDTDLEPAVLKALQSNRPALEMARRAAALPQCRFDVDWNKSPYQILFPHYGELRTLSHLLALEARHEARTGDTEGALRDVRTLFGISHHLRNEPTLIGFLVARAIHAIGNAALSHVLEDAPMGAKAAQQFRDSLPATDWSAFYRQAMLGERAFGLATFNEFFNKPMPSVESFDDGGSDPRGWFKTPLGELWTPFLKLDEVQTLRLWKRHIGELSPMQIPAPIGSGDQFDQAIQDTPFYAILTRLLFPVFARARERRDTIEVVDRQREIALALSAYRAAQGRYPATLTQAQSLWDKPLPPDPYRNAPFLYRTSDDGRDFTLYSVGINRMDDGGRTERDRRKGPPPHPTGDDLRWDAQLR